MKTLVSVAVAGALGLAAVAASVTGASANGWNHGPYNNGPYWGHPHPHYAYAPAPDGGAIVAGALFGLFAGAIVADAVNQPPPSYPAYASSYEAHVAWCHQAYTSYDARSDTWIDFEGAPHQCIERMQ